MHITLSETGDWFQETLDVKEEEFLRGLVYVLANVTVQKALYGDAVALSQVTSWWWRRASKGEAENERVQTQGAKGWKNSE